MVESLDSAYSKSVTPFTFGQVSINLGHENSENYAMGLRCRCEHLSMELGYGWEL
jgi:hypothetical protein